MKNLVIFSVLSILVLLVNIQVNMNYGQGNNELANIEKVSDLLKAFSQISGRFSDHKGNRVTLSYKLVGEESLNGEECWVVNVFYSTKSETTNATLWILKETGMYVKAKIGDTTFSGQHAQAVGIAFQES